MWLYNNTEFTSEDINNYVGFVYIITDLNNSKKYIGKKTLVSRRKLRPLKGQTRRRTKISESNWQSYYGSSEEVNRILEEHGPDRFKREILHLCTSKGEMAYLELKEQMEREVLLNDDYYNGIIQVKIHRNHVKNLCTKVVE